MQDKRTNYWTEFWAQGFISSFPSDYQGNYDKGLKHFWFKQFALLPDNAVILDLCGGNGAIALLAAEYAADHNQQFQITTVDAADINSDKLATLHPEYAAYIDSITYLGNNSVEQLVYPPQSVDLVVSQFGLEYVDDLSALAPVLAALKPNGRLIWVSHPNNDKARQLVAQEVSAFKLLTQLNALARFKKFARNDASQKEMQAFCRELLEHCGKSLLTRVSPLLKGVIEICQFVVSANADRFKSGKSRLFALMRGILLTRMQYQQLQRIYSRYEENPDWYQPVIDNSMTLVDSGEVFHSLNHVVGDYFVAKKG